MAARRRQESYFTRARELFALDALDSYAEHPDQLEQLVRNPAKARAIDKDVPGNNSGELSYKGVIPGRTV
jgi:hypothetical protein